MCDWTNLRLKRLEAHSCPNHRARWRAVSHHLFVFFERAHRLQPSAFDGDFFYAPRLAQLYCGVEKDMKTSREALTLQ